MHRRTPRRIASICLTVAGILCISLAIAMLINNQNQEANAQKTATEAVISIEKSFHTQTKEKKTTPEKEPNIVMPANTEEPVSPRLEMPTIMVDGTAYIGVLEIPTLGLELPIVQSWSDNNLKLAPCRYAGSIYSNNMVIAGHNYRSHFAHLNQLRANDPIYFIDADKNVHPYVVTELASLPDTAIDEMTEANSWDLTLFTCNYSGSERTTIRCCEA